MAKQKYYAVKVGKNVENEIFTSWTVCKEVVLGFPSVYKSFPTMEEAEQYLESKSNIEKLQKQVVYGIEANRKAKENTSTLNLRIDKEVYKSFHAKCKEMDIEPRKAIENLFKE